MKILREFYGAMRLENRKMHRESDAMKIDAIDK